MSNIVRQENLFAAEDFTKIYKSFQDVSFKTYDFDDLKITLVNYIRVHFPEDFNDYVESSEFIAIIELLAFLGTSLAFRIDLNSRENVLDTAQRRESIIRLARMINYRPKRNIAATGLFKLTTIRTDQPITDSIGKSLNDVPVTWADPNNPDWFDQYITILNSAFRAVNPFGHPSKSDIIGGIPTDLYEFNNILGLDVAHPITININGENIAIDIVNPDIDISIEERHPDQNEAFNLIYQNDGLGISSSGTGFFLKFKQGDLKKQDFNFEFPVPNRVQELNATDINETDVYVQEVNDDGSINMKWDKVPAVAGNNIIFNSIAHDQRNIYEVIPGNNNQVSIKFADGNFGNIPTGIIRVWHRISVNRTIIIRPSDIQGQSISLAYAGTDNETYTFNMAFGLESVVANGSPTETNEEIKLRAPQVFYTQQRMINNEDYNVLPLAFGNQLLKVRAINRTHAGHSRYIDINDPTGFHENILLYGDDGALFREESIRRQSHSLSELFGDVNTALTDRMANFLPSPRLKNFFYEFYIPASKTIYGDDYLIATSDGFWKTAPDIYKHDKGYFVEDISSPENAFDTKIALTNGVWNYITDGSVVTLRETQEPYKQFSTSVKSVVRAGFPIDPASGPVELGSRVQNGWKVVSVLPAFRTTFTESEYDNIKDAFDTRQTFGLGYDVKFDEWYVMTSIADETVAFGLQETDPQGEIPRDVDRDYPDSSSWLIAALYSSNEGESTYQFLSRGSSYVFESLRSVRFYFDSNQRDLDLNTGLAREDIIEILPHINLDSEGAPLNRSSTWKISEAIIQSDGFRDPTKVEVLPADLNEDNAPDEPTSFTDLVMPWTQEGPPSQETPARPEVYTWIGDEVVFNKFVDNDGYEKTRLWVTDWVTARISVAPFLFLDISDSVSQTIDEMGFKSLVDPAEVDPGEWQFVRYPLTAGNIFQLLTEEILTAKIGEPIEPTIPESIGLAAQLTKILNPGVGITSILIANAKKFLAELTNKTFLINNAEIGREERFMALIGTLNAAGHLVSAVVDEFHLSRVGRVFEQDSSVILNELTKFNFKWSHVAPADHRIDPSVSNIIDITVLNNSYYTDVLIWKDEKQSKENFPVPPTTSALKTEYASLDSFKSISDQIIYSPGTFKLLFGSTADEELQAKFVAVKIPSATISDSELKTKIIQAIDAYFNINNWDFGERFFYTELAAFIHTNLSKFLGSIVLVPRKGESRFGTLFEILSGPNELFLSTATVADIEIVKNFTGTQLKI